MNTRRVYSFLAVASAILLLAPAAYAGGPLINCQPGVPFAYANGGANVAWNPDQGPLGFLTNADAVAQSAAGFAAWEAVPSSSITFTQGAPLPVNVDSTNFLPYLNAVAPDGLSAVIYDEDGSIFNLLFGFGTGVLGFSSPEWGVTANCEITESYAWINGGVLAQGFPANEMACVQHHEFGHFINLAHTVVNEQIAGFLDYTGPAPYDTFGFPVNLVNLIETMSPFIFINGGQCDAHADDVMSVSNVYPAAGYPGSAGSMTGQILAPNGVTQLTGVNVIARNVANPFEDAVSALSSDLTDDFSQGAPFVGQYTLNNLTPGAEYAVYVDGILAGGFSTPPLSPLPGPEEFYNGAGESSDPDTDDPSVYTTVAAAAGSQATGIDIIFNAPAPGVPLPLGDDDNIELFLPFTFNFCGQSYSSLFVNSNGSVTFGGGDNDYSESVLDHLADRPRIAGVWDDLNPSGGGVVTFYPTKNDFTVSFQNVPEFPAAGANSFDIVLSKSSDKVEIFYGDLTSADGLAGLSCGGLKTTGGEAEDDLSFLSSQAENGTINARNQAARYEIFTSFDNDLAGQTLSFNSPNAFKDSFEKNDTFGDAKSVSLPFNSADRRGDSEIFDFTEIAPIGGDVDYFRFTADAGQTLLAEVTNGSMDSVLGLFDADGNLVAADDDGGVGLLSRLQYPMPAAGQYTLAVSTFPDFDFSGDGGSGARYILNVQTITGFVLSLGDDDTEEVAIDGFSFPFQGGSYSSVFVNSNGSLTFGAGSTDYSESISEFLNGPPRIAPLWDDLSPNNGGQVLVSQDAGSFTVSFENVPEFLSTGANSFSVTLYDTGEFEVSYGATNGNDGLAGVTEGGGAANPGPSDLSSSASWPGTGTTYQLFYSGQFDLDFSTLTFIP